MISWGTGRLKYNQVVIDLYQISKQASTCTCTSVLHFMIFKVRVTHLQSLAAECPYKRERLQNEQYYR
jgi:hypothetical protein